MKILHTSDWHLGRTLHSKKERQTEHQLFFEWLLKTIEANAIDLLLVAGDIFDNGTPNSTSQKMYYDFLVKVKNTACENVIIVGGNHDSPSFLNAPKHILSVLNVRVIGNATENIDDEIVIVKDKNGKPSVIVCGVPFLRERDISRFAEGENYTDRSKRINENIKRHYGEIASRAEHIRADLGVSIPIIATGHSSVAGGKRNDDDGVRETYIGNIEAIGSDIFPDTFDYVALGHYHIPSVIKEHIRYCGSPIPMGFGEAGQTKVVYVIHFSDKRKIETIHIPVFQKLESIVGNKNFIANRLAALKQEDIAVWTEIIYKGDEIFPDLASWVNAQIADSKIENLKLSNRQFSSDVLTHESAESLEELSAYDVFDKLLEKNNITEEQQAELKDSYHEIITALNIKE